MIEGHDYTIYSKGPSGRSRMYALLALITAFLTPLVQHGFLAILRRFGGNDWDVAQAALFFGGFTALLIFGVLVNVFNTFLWRTRFGSLMFRFAGLTAPPYLVGEYRGRIEVRSPTDPEKGFQTAYQMRIAQTWEQISILVERAGEAGGHVRVHSDMASVCVGMISDIVTLRFRYTFEENLARREGSGTMTRQFSGDATFEFRQVGRLWVVEGHFFDDIGRSGQIELRQVIPGSSDLDHSKQIDETTGRLLAEPGATTNQPGD